MREPRVGSARPPRSVARKTTTAAAAVTPTRCLRANLTAASTRPDSLAITGSVPGVSTPSDAIPLDDPFRQLDELLPTPTDTRTASGAPGHRYWQQQVDYDIDVTLDEAVLKDGEAVGYISSGGYAHHVKKSMAMAYVATEHAGAGSKLQVEILGEFHDAEVQAGPVYDANGANMRS